MEHAPGEMAQYITNPKEPHDSVMVYPAASPFNPLLLAPSNQMDLEDDRVWHKLNQVEVLIESSLPVNID